jgi:hypothetical protein
VTDAHANPGIPGCQEASAPLRGIGTAVSKSATQKSYNTKRRREDVMIRRGIKSYVIGWEPGRNRAVASLQLEDGTHHAIKIETAAELAAIAAILKESPVFLYENGLIVTGWEEIKH